MGALTWLSVVAAAASTALAMTPEKMISAPRRSEVIPNPSGEIGVFSTSQYSFEKHKRSSWWSLLDLKTGQSKILTNDSSVSEILWLGTDDSTLLYVNGTNADVPGGVELWVTQVSSFTNGYKAASLPAAFSGFKTVTTKSGDIRFVAYAQSYANGTAYNEELVEKPLSSARIYDSIYVRHWDSYLTTTFNAVFSGTLKKGNNKKGYTLDGAVKNLVSPVRNAESPYPPFGGASDYDLSPNGKWVAFKSKAPELPKANFTTAYIYLVPHDGSEKAFAINGPDSPGTPKGIKGDANSPVFSPNSEKLAYLQMKDETYEADRRVLYVYSIGSKKTIPSVAGNWDRSPDSIKWTPDGKTLIVGSEDKGRSRLFAIPATARDDFKPKNFTDGGAVSAYYFLPDRSLLVTGTAIWTNWNVYTASPAKGVIKTLASANEIDPELKGLGPSDVSEIYFKGNWTDIHAWVVYPENFDKSKKYPLAFLIHGGPQGSWADSWSSRWNPKTFADQGYVVVAPNPTGSTGFGQKLTDEIQNNWGGAPYDDLVKCWEYVNKNLPFVDTEHGIAAGASYGGFMVNWIQGNDLGRRFKALVSHDGTFVADAKISTDELWFMQREFNGTFWDARDNYRRFDPSAPEHIRQFGTPQLVIHNDKDYRLAVAEGLSLFNVLQERGVPSRFLNFPDENHWVVNPENSLVWHQQVLGWINKYSGIEKSNPGAVSLDDTIVPVVNYN
ncbi:dipeptidyl peptidase DppV [Aspergillus clavatus NRRL 1]|uniref:Probable dipeptidyl-peptidase 5 n=1 Tax=Aspergillus clavatus (strain ATCC 1007 / CBS 513.65 / DSM 816 / NCTC 3887 / NRRL 1 / QM 1276 / 107) TaxID=344612 RepID=DPP5_ASPCL|nr:secreted dipeptidyl peptidase [Aspergillus clavatus NRRL 1]A1CSW4.1 RecName: Full=Probable dipeptidyl-peptidase 5; AltName: Full=Dipeptidyl-peptidase V; Short=DPP V; Short=DppV; Flags: Precursor [Aspergillus clavatus NRRL 1]EAW06401.1 secreted dipeptidyl peptidase [Aspergillus clavatus NRRL 1]